MGEVDRAKDTKLKRQVALKVLPNSFAGDPEWMARFQREAEVLAVTRSQAERVVRSGKVEDYAELAPLAHISSARIGQIVMLGLLAVRCYPGLKS